MTLKTKYNKDNLRQIKSFDYWWNVIVGGLLTLMILIPLGWLILIKINFVLWIYPYSIFCIIIVIYYQWHDDNLTSIKTGFSKIDNFNLVTTCLKDLGWHYNKTAKGIDLKLNKYILKFLNPTIIPENGEVLVNFKYCSTNRTGRPTFFFGISTYLEWTFKRSLENHSLSQTS